MTKHAVSTYDYTSNLTPLGFAPRPNPAPGVFNSDLAFWGDYAAQGTYDGFRIVDITYPQRPKEVLPFVTILEVPLANPAATAIVGSAPLTDAGACHDSGVILGSVDKMVCASHSHASVFDIGANETPGGSLTNPQFLYTISEPGVGDGTQGSGNWHSAAWTWDGEVIILGWEPGGGSQPRCTATGTVLPGGVVQTDTHKSYFFYDAKDGSKLGQFVLPRDQTTAENCTIHNYNVVPLKNKRGKPRYVLVAGNYQAGISVVDFTNPAAAKEVAYADPAPLVPMQLGGDWSTYWYNGRIYESDITRGLIIWRLDDPAVATLFKSGIDHLHPQTQEVTID